MKKYYIVFLIPILVIASCSRYDKSIEDAVSRQMSLYPKSTLIDLYKCFCQAQLGAEHIVSDTTAAGRYLDAELETVDSPQVLYEPIGSDSAFFRVHLKAVQQGFISRKELFDAFIGGIKPVSQTDLEEWKEKWKTIESTISSMDLGIASYDGDKALLDSIVSSDQYAVHHSEEFSDAYHPHYRIIRKDIFYSNLFEKLCE